ncbi:MAG: insulinase family protein, partial [Candidatus Obscuribacterales bacterium]|nr:insulinase family protein [Candidatus Obscuribacterales bacterium]
TYAYARALRDPSLLAIEIDLTETASLAEAEAAVLAEIETLKSVPVDACELARIKTGMLKSDRLNMAETRYFAYQLGNAEAVADWLWLLSKADAIEAVTSADILRVASSYLTRNNCTVGAFIPKTEEELAEKEAATQEPEAVAVKAKKAKKGKKAVDPDAVIKTLNRYAGMTPERAFISERIVTRKLPNGLTVNVVTEKVGSGVLAAGITVRAGNFFEPQERQNRSDIVASMLPMGSTGLDKSELADRLTELGMTDGIHFHTRPYISQSGFQVLSDDLSPALTLVETVVTKPVFAQSDLDTVKRQWMGRYKEELSHPGSVAQNKMGSALYDPSHSFYQKPTEKQMADLSAMTVGELRAFHARYYTPANTIVTIVGDIEADAAIDMVESVFGDWQGPAASPYVVEPTAAVEPVRIDINMPDKPGVEIVMGKVLDLKKADPDYLAAQIGTRILGGDTLTARLGKKLREEGGLTYGVYAGTWDDSFGGSPWYVALSVNAANVDKAIEMARQVMTDLVDNGISERELATEVESMVGSHNLSVSTIYALASKISQLTILGMSLDEIDAYGTKLRAITVEDVNRAVRKHFDPANLITVVAGEL